MRSKRKNSVAKVNSRLRAASDAYPNGACGERRAAYERSFSLSAVSTLVSYVQFNVPDGFCVSMHQVLVVRDRYSNSRSATRLRYIWPNHANRPFNFTSILNGWTEVRTVVDYRRLAMDLQLQLDAKDEEVARSVAKNHLSIIV